MGRTRKLPTLARSISASNACLRLMAFLVAAAASLIITKPVMAQAPWPGQSGNPVGYAAWGSLGTKLWTGGSFTSGTATNPTIYTGYIFTSGQSISGSYIWFVSCDFQGGLDVSGNNVAIIGSRIQSNAVGSMNVTVSGSNVSFLYDSVEPLASLTLTPPGSVWPSAGSGANSQSIVDGVNATPYSDSYQYGIQLTGNPTKNLVVDHSDIWGFGNAIDLFEAGTGPVTITNSWIHDAAGNNGGAYHTDGIGYLNGGSGPSNVTIQGNTIATLGNTHDIAFQQATGGYANLKAVENYLSGNQYAVSWCAPGSVNCTNSAFFGNVYGTDIMPEGSPLYGGGITLGSGSAWACNTIAYRSGTSWSAPDTGWAPTSSMNGEFWVPQNTANSKTDYQSNTVCPSFAPSSVDFMLVPTNTTSSGVTVTLSNAGPSTLSISSIALQSGTNFAISSKTCGSSLGAGSSCTITVTFSPTSNAVYMDNLQISDNAPAASNPQKLPLIGLGGGSSTSQQPAAPTGLVAAIQ